MARPRFQAPSEISLRRRCCGGEEGTTSRGSATKRRSARLVFDAAAVSAGSGDRHRFSGRKFLECGDDVIFCGFNVGGIDRWFVVDRAHVGDHPGAIDDDHVRGSSCIVEMPDDPVGVEQVIPTTLTPPRTRPKLAMFAPLAVTSAGFASSLWAPRESEMCGIINQPA